MWNNDYRFTPPSDVETHACARTRANRNTNTLSSGGLFNYFAFSLQITQEHLGLGEQESDAERVMMASAEFPWRF